MIRRSRRLPLFLLAALLPIVAWTAGPCGASDAGAEPSKHKPAGAPTKGSEAAVEQAAEHKAAAEHNDPLGHVVDVNEIHLFHGIPPIHLPKILGFQLTKYMVLELLAALLVVAFYVPLARRVANGTPAHGWRDNAFEVLLTFIREDVAKPNLGEHDADKYVPFLWTMFLFILFCNLLGMIPFLGSPTASIYVTGGLAVCSFVAIQAAAVAKMGLVPYLKTLWPHLDIPVPVMGFVIKLLIFVIELVGTFIKSGVLAVRLFANMLAGHAVLATIMLFILMAANASVVLWASVTAASVLGVVALSLLELFVAFLQAYIFVFLTALFMGMTLHPQH